MELRLPAGNEAVRDRVARLLSGRGLSHAYIVSGPAGAGKRALADFLCRAYVCTGECTLPCGRCSGCRKAAAGIHPDVTVAGGGAQRVSVHDARALRADAYIRPNEAPRKVYLFPEAQALSPQVQDVLLKLLEEGPRYAAFLLLAENEAALLPTIRSRCETLRLVKAEAPAAGGAGDGAETLAALLADADERALLEYAVSLEGMERPALTALLDDTAGLLLDALKRRAGDAGQARRLSARIELLSALRRACAFNVGAGHLAGWLAAGAHRDEL
ncbi:MAG: DNA polymerase III subunit delta [Clostridiales bacterium]|nr:DNA polymerase III subunit delta [Clostridiales bacterium]